MPEQSDGWVKEGQVYTKTILGYDCHIEKMGGKKYNLRLAGEYAGTVPYIALAKESVETLANEKHKAEGCFDPAPEPVSEPDPVEDDIDEYEAFAQGLGITVGQVNAYIREAMKRDDTFMQVNLAEDQDGVPQLEFALYRRTH